MLKLLLLPLFLFSSFYEQLEAEERITVAVSLPPYKTLVERIGGSLVEVIVVVPKGANPHLYEPTPQSVKEVSTASLWFLSGDPFEKKIIKAIPPSVKTYNLLTPLNLAHHHTSIGCEEGCDLHVWLDPQLVIQQIPAITQALVTALPLQEGVIRTNAARIAEELRTLYKQLQTDLKPYQGEAILVSHAAFSYFCKAFHLRELAVEKEGKEPLPADLSKLLDLAKKLSVRVALVQAQYNNKGTVMIAKKLHIPIYSFDPYDENYDENLKLLAHLIIHGKKPS